MKLIILKHMVCTPPPFDFVVHMIFFSPRTYKSQNTRSRVSEVLLLLTLSVQSEFFQVVSLLASDTSIKISHRAFLITFSLTLSE